MATMSARVKWIDGMRFAGFGGGGGAVIMDGKKEAGPSPMEMLLLGAGGCSSIDVVMILEKMRQAVDDVEVALSAERAETDPKVFTRIAMHFIVTGRGLDDKKVARAVQLSAEKYCSASIMLGQVAEVTHTHETVESPS